MSNSNKNVNILYSPLVITPIVPINGTQLKLYRRFFQYIYRNSKYINDFFDISTIRQRISTYRQISTQLK
ncbi:hypothetical protein COK41_06495 [Bacillus cereus]|nr:hypothetical protein COK41_06495 [Bacillus cereus]